MRRSYKEPSASEVRDIEMRRMLLWFRSQLPPHTLGYWRLELQPHTRSLLNEDTRSNWSMYYNTDSIGHVRGCASCTRCGKQFDVPDIGNFSVHYMMDEEGATKYPALSVDSAMASAREWVVRLAERDGECWGDVPEIPDGRSYVIAD